MRVKVGIALRRNSPRVLIIGTEHESEQESYTFKRLNQIAKHDADLFWLCEGESDFRICSSLKDFQTHVLTDALFIYMIVEDLRGIDNPKKHFLYQELIDRLIEWLLTLARQPSGRLKNSINKQLSKSFMNWMRPLADCPVSQDTLSQIEKSIRRIPVDNLMSEIYVQVRKIVDLLIKQNKIPVGFIATVQSFVKKVRDCHGCEDKLFMVMRDQSFWKQIDRHLHHLRHLHHVDSSLTVITVGLDHCHQLFKQIQDQFPDIELNVWDHGGSTPLDVISDRLDELEQKDY